MEHKMGLKIIMVKSVEGTEDFIKAESSITGLSVEQAILNCYSKGTVITIVAFSLKNAIERVLYRLNALSKEKREFFLSQIAWALVEVVDMTCKKATPIPIGAPVKDSIREDKLYRIATYLEKNEKEKV